MNNYPYPNLNVFVHTVTEFVFTPEELEIDPGSDYLSPDQWDRTKWKAEERAREILTPQWILDHPGRLRVRHVFVDLTKEED